ncbi:unnamed protein product, partial [Rotaria magnacalcarata]
SISSTFTDRSSPFDEKYNTQQTNLNQSDNFTSVAPTLFTDRFDDEYLNLPSDDENEILLNTSLSSISSSSSSSDGSSSDDELENMNMSINSSLPDHRPLHSSTSTTVFQFSLDILEFCRISRLPDEQRIDLLELFQKYIPSPNLVPKSGEDLLVKFIHDILRRTRSFVNVQKWKASEVRLFILYIGLPVLVEFLPEDVCGDLALYNTILRLLHDYWENDKKLSDAISSLLKIYIKNLSKNINANLCPPKLLTISTHIHLHLPLQCKKFGRLDWFTNVVFESFLGFLKAFVEGSSGAGNQIAIAFISNFFLPKTKENKNHLCGHFCINNETFGSNILKMKIVDISSVRVGAIEKLIEDELDELIGIVASDGTVVRIGE